MQQRLSLIDVAFIKGGIKPLIIKGPASSLQLYGNPITREYTDIDLVISPNSFSQVVPIMENLGYKEKSGSSHLPDSKSVKEENVLVQKVLHLVFTSSQSPFRIEIHNSFFSGLSYNKKYTNESVLERSETLIYQGISYNVPSLKDHVLLLIMHGSKHAWQSLHWLIDLVVVLSIDDENLHLDVCSCIEDLGLQKHTALMISVVKELFVVNIPSPYMKYYNKYNKDVKKQLAFALDKLTSANTINLSIRKSLVFSWKYLRPLTVGSTMEKLK